MAAPYLEEVRCGRRLKAAEARAGRLQILGWLGDDRDLTQIADGLKDSSPLVAIVALRALIRRREARAVGRIIANLDRFRFWNVRTIASLLAEIGPPIAPLLRRKVLDGRHDLRTRVICLTTLQEIGGIMAVHTAVEVLAEAEDRPLVTGSLRILEAAGDESHLPILRRMSRSDDEVVRLRAYGALSAIDSKSDLDRFETALSDRNTWVAMQAAQALLKAGRTDALERAASGTSDRAELAKQVLSQDRRHRQ